ncbi:MAG TPA: FxSxx-COOH system tetratricopeptide repeat protein, partial [Streptomyces sp.]|nr:FxSxx-COOH system tetratricopeptide repeat protein [Streptomyces sp.]
SQERWLIVLDNAEDPERLEALLPDGPGHVLITSRNPAWGKIVPGLQLGVFSREESMGHLTGQLPSLTEEQADALAEALGDLPLALTQAAGVLSDGMPVDQYLRVLETNTAQLLDHGKAHGYPASLAASIGIAQDRLKDGHQEAVAVLRLASLLGPEPVPTGWLVAARPRLTTVPGDPGDFRWPQNALNPLARYGLAVVGTDAFQVHRLTQAVVRQEATGDVDAGALWDDVAALLTRVEPGDPDLPEAWPGWAALTPHLTSGLEPLSGRAELRRTLLMAATYLVRSAQPQAARQLAESLHRTWAVALGEDHPDVLDAAHMVTWALDGLGAHPEVLPLVEDVLERRRRVLGEDHPDTLRSSYDLGVTQGNLGRPMLALAILQDVLTRRRATLGDDHLETLRSADAVAGALGDLGRYEEAHEMTVDVLERRRSMSGDGHPHTLGSTQNLVLCLTSLGRGAEAHRLATDTLERYRAVFGDDHPETLRMVRTLVGALLTLDKVTEAHRVSTDALDRCRALFAEDHTQTVHAAHGVGVTLLLIGRPEDAHRMLSDVLERRRQKYSDDHPHSLQATHNLARALHDLGSHSEAERLLRAIRARIPRVLGDTHRLNQAVALTLADALAAQGKHFEAQKLRSATVRKIRSQLRRR